jgi:hypothetical protein
MSTARQPDMRGRRKWAVPAVCLIAAGAFLGIFLARGQVSAGISSAAIMLIYGAVLVVSSGRSDIAAILRNDAADERRLSINMRASAFALQVVVLVAVVMFLIQLGAGRVNTTWQYVCEIIGVSYVAAVVYLSRRG